MSYSIIIRVKTSYLLIKQHLSYVTFISTLLIGLSGIILEPAYANPVGGVVTSGQANISNVTPDSTVINQSTDKAIINWQSFNIDQNQKTTFVQPSSSSITLNRVIGNDPSSILGTLSANGNIILLNGSGILFGQDSQVDVGGLIASTGNIADNDFLAGNYHFTQSTTNTSSAVNAGNIQAIEGGLVALIGNTVRNDGNITAHLGKVALVSGNDVTVDLNGDNLIYFGSGPQVISGDGVTNNGTILADGGKVVLAASLAKGVVDNAVNMSGIIQARSVGVKNGEVILSVGNEGTVKVSGKIDLSGKNSGEKGGTAKVLGNVVYLASGAEIDASGSAGGGEVLVGGNFHGAGPEINSQLTWIDPSTLIDVSAIDNGNGGKIAVWSDGTTYFDGNLLAQGGPNGGDGGFIEVSGGILNYLGVVNLLATEGINGTLLLDPYDIVISNSPTSNITFSGSPNSTITPTASSNLYIVDLVNALNVGNVIVDTGPITPGTGGTVNIGVPLSWSSGNSLTINAAIEIDIPLTVTATNGATLILNSPIILIEGTLNGAFNLVINSEDSLIASNLGQTTPLTSITVTGPIAMGNITTTGSQTYNNTVTQNGSSTSHIFTSTGGGNITFASLNNSLSLTVNTAGVSTFNNTVSLASLTTDAAGSTVLKNAVSTTGSQTYNDAINLLGNTTLVSTGSGAVTLGSTVNGGFDLAVNTAGVSTFGGVVGGSTALASLTTNTGGSTILNGNVTTTGAQSYNDAVTLGNSVTLTGTTPTFLSVAGGGNNLSLGFTGITNISNILSNLNNLTVQSGGTSTQLQGTITTSGSQIYNSLVNLLSNTTLVSTGSGAVTLGSTVNGGFDLAVNTAGVSTFEGVVGGSTALASLTTNTEGSTVLKSAISTTGSQIYNDAVNLLGNTTLASTGSGAITLGSTVNGGFGLTVNTAGVSTFEGVIGGSTALTSLTTNAGGSTVLKSGITTSGSQTYNDAVNLLGNTTLASTGSGAITLGSTVNGGFGLAVNTAGVGTFEGVVGGSTALTSLSTNIGGSTVLKSAISTTGSQIYNDAVNLLGNTTLASTGSNTVAFVSTVNGGFGLTVNTAGVSSFGDVVGGSTALASLTTNTGGSTILNGNITTTGAQSYNDAVTLGNSVTLTGTTPTFLSILGEGNDLTLGFTGITNISGILSNLNNLTVQSGGTSTQLQGTITTSDSQIYNSPVNLLGNTVLASIGSGAVTLGSTVNGGFDLAVNTAGVSTFGGVVGGSTALASLITNTGGSTILNGNVTTTGTQSYNDAVTLGNSVTLTGTTPTFLSIAGGGKSLTLGFTGITNISSILSNLNNLTVQSGGTSTQLQGTITTSGSQIYNSPVNLLSNTVLASTGGSALTLGSTVNGGFGLTVNTAGVSTFEGVIGGSTALTSLTTNAGGSTVLKSAITTSGSQTYNDGVNLLGDTTLTSSGNGAITLDGTVDGNYALMITTGGITTFNEPIGGNTALGSLTTSPVGTTIMNGSSVNTSGLQIYNGNLISQNPITFNSSTNTINFGTLGLLGNGDLIVNARGIMGNITNNNFNVLLNGFTSDTSHVVAKSLILNGKKGSNLTGFISSGSITLTRDALGIFRFNGGIVGLSNIYDPTVILVNTASALVEVIDHEQETVLGDAANNQVSHDVNVIIQHQTCLDASSAFLGHGC